MNMSERGTGRTSRQLKFAPQGAIFIWCNDRLTYPKTLAKAHWINRPDLQIVAPSWLEHGWIGQTLGGLVIDHAARLSERQAELLCHALTRVRESPDRRLADAYFEKIAIAMMSDEQALASLERWREGRK